MSIDNWVNVGIAIIGFSIAMVTAGLSYRSAKKLQIKAGDRRLKEKFYLNYIEAMSNLVVSNNNEKKKGALADAKNRLLLVGGLRVVEELLRFHNYVCESNKDKATTEGHDEILTDLLKCMREDLYDDKKINKGFPKVSLTGGK